MSGTVTNNKVAMVSGCTGQAGSFLAEILLEKGYKVIGLKRRTSLLATDRIDHLLSKHPNFSLHYFDLADTGNIWNLLEKHKPNEFYNLACQSHVKVSFEQPEYTCDTAGFAVIRILEAIRAICPTCKFYQSSSSELYGVSKDYDEKGYTEESQMIPASPYACAKMFAYNVCNNYRGAYGMYICNGILFNMESARRGETFVTQKIVNAVAAIKHGKQKELRLGNLDAKRDWGHSKEYARAMYLMMQYPVSDNYVVATGKTNSVRDFCKLAFEYAGLDYSKYVVVDPVYFRPQEVPYLLGNASKAKQVLGWEAKTTFEELVKEMYDAAEKRILRNCDRV